MQSDSEDKQDQPKLFREVRDFMIDGHPKMTKHDASEKHTGRSDSHTANAEPP